MLQLRRPTLRKHKRQHMRRAAWLSLGNASPPIRCVVWDFSEGGCRLAAPHAIDLPEVFVLIMRQTSEADLFCRVIWRKDSFVGVKFIEAAEVGQLAKTASDARTTSRGLYWKEDRASWSDGYRKTTGETVSTRKLKNAGKRPRFNIQLY